MKKILTTFFIAVSASYGALAQNNVGINNPTPHASAALDVVSTTQGVLVPRVTTSQRTTGISNPAKGLLVYDSTLNTLYAYDGASWNSVGPSVQLYTTSNATQQTTPWAYNRYLFSFSNVVSGAGAAAWTNGNTFTVPAGMSGLYDITVNLLVTAYNTFTSVIPAPEIEVMRNGTSTYYYGVGIYSGVFQGNGTNGTGIGPAGAPYSFSRGLAQATVPLQTGDVVRVYYRTSSAATNTSFSISFSTDGSTSLRIMKLN